jgi:hypothetical protein
MIQVTSRFVLLFYFKRFIDLDNLTRDRWVQVFCQLCGVSFNINRIRTAEEPRNSSWAHGMRLGWVEGSDYYGCTPEDGCSAVYRGDPYYTRREPDLLDDVDEEEDPTYEYESASDNDVLEYDSDAGDEDVDMREEESNSEETDDEEPEWIFSVYPPPAPAYDTEFLPLDPRPDKTYDSDDGSSEAYNYMKRAQEATEKLEHIAGHGCKNTQGYHGGRISMEEMRNCQTVQCLLGKNDEWALESGDLDCEFESNSYLTGLDDHMPSSGGIIRFTPVRHGARDGDATVEFHGRPVRIIPFDPCSLRFIPNLLYE